MSGTNTEQDDHITYFEGGSGAISNIEENLLQERLNPVDNASYQDDCGCMSGTRTHSVAYSPDGRNIVSGSSDDTIRIWDAKAGILVKGPLKGDTFRVNSVAYSPDSRHIASGCGDFKVRIWDAATGILIGEPFEGHRFRVSSIIYSSDGRKIVSGSHDRTIRIWDVATGKQIGEPLTGHTKSVTSVAYSPDNQRIVSGSYDGTIRVWDVTTGSSVGDVLATHSKGVASVAYSPDGQKIVSCSYDCTIRQWDAAVAYSPDGRNIVSGSSDNTIRIWNAAIGAPVGEPLKGHTNFVTSVAYSPDGRNIVSGSYDHTVRVWDALQIPNNIPTSSGPFSLPPQISDKVLLNSSGPNTVSSITLNSKAINPKGWVRCDNGILLWVPEDCRHGVTSQAIRTFPPEAWQRRVRLDLSDFKYGDSWVDVYTGM
ncbi:hypothetical protein M408DRAFT_326926 [Serendipita vermifera MAFF 305830]|uniref:Uncharacterized protein n=1 Tax=Serendipita vermifera MAFF 305830 TaxID=933852 RepID=A0A0C3BJR0_SERVB|nr:hypothetical protein M408DRAFT_326926 [Serendipita vermifera MAFF 305830]